MKNTALSTLPVGSRTDTWEDIFHYSDEEMDKFDEIVHSMAHLIMEFSQEGGFDNASNF